MKTRTLKRIASCTVALSIIALNSLQFANCVVSAENVEDVELLYVENVVSRYLSTTEYSSMEDISISTAVPFYDFEDEKQVANEYAVFYDDEVIGVLYVQNVEGEYQSSFRECQLEEFQSAYNEKTDIAIGTYEDETIVYDGVDFLSEEADEENICDLADNIDEKIVEAAPVEMLDVELQPVAYADTSLSKVLTVKPVPNNEKNGGLCWAASIASKYNYLHHYSESNSKYVDALTVNNRVRDYCGTKDNVSLGFPKYIIQGLGLYGLLNTYSGVQEDYRDHQATRYTMSSTELYRELYWNNPVIISVFGSTGGHSLIISGVYCFSDGSAIYQIVDSNFSEPVLVNVTTDAAYTGDTFVYANEAYGGKFTTWRATYSYKFSPGT